MSSLIRKIEENRNQIEDWFEHMHRHPELSMKEHNTAEFIAGQVKQWGYQVETGIGQFGIVASLKVGDSDKTIGLRADFDALPIQEVNDLSYKSEVQGVSHLCGHDGQQNLEKRRLSIQGRLFWVPKTLHLCFRNAPAHIVL